FRNPQKSSGFHTHHRPIHKSTSYSQRPRGGLKKNFIDYKASITMKAVLGDDDDTQKNLLNKLKNEYQNGSSDKKSLKSKQENPLKKNKKKRDELWAKYNN
ncbi:101_t:CDS:2, partial [Gigaspora rosea]